MASALVMGAATSAAAQDDHRLAGRFDSSTSQAVQLVMTRAHTQGLPVEPLVDRALEGLTLRQPGSRIVAAVEALAKRLSQARDALAPRPDTEEIAAGADALSAGLKPTHLQRIRAIRPAASVAVPLAVVAQLVSSGVEPQKATAMVERLMRGGAAPIQLIALNDSVRRDVASGMRPDAALDLRGRGIMGTMRPPLGTADGTTQATIPGRKRP
jgi:hypothetical protein